MEVRSGEFLDHGLELTHERLREERGGGGAIKSTAAPIILRLKLKMRLDKLRNFVYFAAAHNKYVIIIF